MKAQFTSKLNNAFSTIELLLALALISVILVSTLEAITYSQYWFLTAQTANEALYKNKINSFLLVTRSKDNFQTVSTTKSIASVDPNSLSDASCIEGGQCYFKETLVTDVSSCAKNVLMSISWKISQRYSTSSVTLSTYIPNLNEIIAVGGDCLISPLPGSWYKNTPFLGNQINLSPMINTGIDVMGNYMYVSSSLSPHFRIFEIYENATQAPVLVSSTTALGLRLNDVEVVKDFISGRTYAYVMQHSSSSQLLVFDVTNPNNPSLLSTASLHNVESNGSFPQGWRVVAYGGQLFVVSRETAGPELHIFSLDDPRNPIEKTAAAINLNRTVNDMIVRDEVINGMKRTFLYLAGSSDLKEVGVYDVTESTPIEVAAINLNGSADAIAIYLNGSILYVGRKSNTSAELYAFNNQKLIQNQLEILATAEVGGDVFSLLGAGSELIVGTGRNGAELQIWSTQLSTWNSGILNKGQISTVSSPRLAPLGIDVSSNNLFILSQAQNQPETISVFYSP